MLYFLCLVVLLNAVACTAEDKGIRWSEEEGSELHEDRSTRQVVPREDQEEVERNR